MANHKDFDRLLLYFLLILGIIAIVLWTLFLVQNSQIVEKAFKNQAIANLTQLNVNLTKTEVERKNFAMDAVENITKSIEYQLLDLKGQLIEYMSRDNETNTKMVDNQNIVIKLLLDTVNSNNELAIQHINNTKYHDQEAEKSKLFSELNVNMTKINKKNIQNILDNITEIQKTLNNITSNY